MQKYMSRKPYYIIAGPTYGVISASGLVGPDYNYSQEELHIIEPYGVNCMVYRPNFGTFINANQTAKQTPVSALSRVNVRELVIYLQDEIEKVLQSYQWEFNNATTRNAILNRANAICSNIQSNGGIQAFVNIMDESNNGPEIIDNEMAVLSTHIEPGFGCGKMVHELTLYKTGGLSSATFD
jgi:L-2-hydroxyglutarate oxidase LhgO